MSIEATEETTRNRKRLLFANTEVKLIGADGTATVGEYFIFG